MNCIIPATNLKGKAFQTLSKIERYFYIEATNESFQIATINQSQTAFCKFTFNSSFFTNLTTSKDKIVCNVHMNSNVFNLKTPEDKIQCCKLEIDEEASLLIVTITYKLNYYVKDSMKLLEKDTINVNCDLSSLKNEICVGKTVFQTILTNFQSNDDHMNVEFKPDQCVISNYDSDSEYDDRLRSQITLKNTEFFNYKIENEVNIGLGFKPFKIAGQFCEYFNLKATINFDRGEGPFVISINDPTFNVCFIISSVILDNRMEVTVDEMSGNVEEQPDSPQTRKLKIVFARCFKDKFDDDEDMGEVLVPNTDSE